MPSQYSFRYVVNRTKVKKKPLNRFNTGNMNFLKDKNTKK